MANGAYSFDGSNDGINFAHIATLDGASKLTIAFWLYVTGTSFGTYLAQTGDTNTGPGNTSGFGIYRSNFFDNTILRLQVVNVGFSQKITGSGALTAATWLPIWIVYDGTQASASDRLRLWISGSEYTAWATDSADFPTTIGTTDQKLTIAYDETSGSGGNFNPYTLADLGLLFGRAVTDSTIASHAAGQSIGNFVATGDFWASFRINQNDEKGSRTGTLVDAPTLTTGPSLTYPGGGGPSHNALLLMGVG